MRTSRPPATADPKASTSNAGQVERGLPPPRSQAFTLFDTAIGPCAVAWGQDGITGVMLPDAHPAQTRVRLRRLFPGASEVTPPPEIQPAVDAITALLRGETTDLSFIGLDMEGVPDFHRRVYAIARTIPSGTTISYGEIASRLGEPHAARAVGQALGRNPFPIVVPCHRVLAADGRTGGFSAPGGVSTKLRLLAIEGERLI